MLRLETKYIVEVSIHDSLDRLKKSRIVGVWKKIEDIPFEKIRKINEFAHPGKKIEIHARVYEDI
jgi:hypothetical protein